MISIVINCDTRAPKSEAGAMFDGTRSWDYLTDGVINKVKFFDGFEKEVILFIDEHQHIPNNILDLIRPFVDKLVISKHSKHYRGMAAFNAFNDINYIHALSLCRGDIVAHFDQDVAAFTNGRKPVEFLLNCITDAGYNFVCYPSANSPDPVHDDSYQGKWWASTRFFMCLREKIDLTALEHSIREPQWAYSTFGQTPRVNPWVEHFLTLIAGHSVFYPPIDIDRYAIFPWSKYKDGLLAKLNAMPYGEVADAIYRAGGLPYDGIDANLMNV